MRFKQFLELQGIFGNPSASGGEGVIRSALKKPVQGPFGKGKSPKKLMNAGPSIAKPARPVGVTYPTKPMTTPSVIK